MAEKINFPELVHTDELFLHELSPEIERLHNRHDQHPREFFPYDFADEMDAAIATKQFIPEESPLPDEVIGSLFVNLLTEDGLPYYTATLMHAMPKVHAFKDWLHTWTAEEGRHAPTIANYIHRTKQMDMRLLERARMAMMIHPDTPQPSSFIEGVVYPAFQEPATEESHRNTMLLLPKAHKIGRKALGFVIGDEKKHGDFYVDLTEAAMQVNPSFTIIAIARQVESFAMPGKSIPGFNQYKAEIEKAGIFGAEQLKKIYDRIITDRLKIWGSENLSSDAEKARDWLDHYLTRMGRTIAWVAEKRAAKLVTI